MQMNGLFSRLTNYLRANPRTRLFVLGGLGLLLLLVLTAIFSGSTTKKSSPTVSTVTSPFSGTVQNIDADANSINDPNQDAVQQPFLVFGLNDLPILPDTAYALQETLPSALSREVSPTFAPTYVQIDKRTFHCNNKYDCSFSFYIDSPERYFEFHLYTGQVGTYHTLKQMPLPGVDS